MASAHGPPLHSGSWVDTTPQHVKGLLFQCKDSPTVHFGHNTVFDAPTVPDVWCDGADLTAKSSPATYCGSSTTADRNSAHKTAWALAAFEKQRKNPVPAVSAAKLDRIRKYNHLFTRTYFCADEKYPFTHEFGLVICHR